MFFCIHVKLINMSKKKAETNLTNDSLLKNLIGIKNITIATETIPTGIKVLDAILNGGIMKRAINLITGVTGCGKSQLALQIAKQFKEYGHSVLYFDIEMSITKQRIKHFNLDMDTIISYTYTIEEFDRDVLDNIKLAFEKNPDLKLLIVIDSISALRSAKILDAQIDDNLQPGIEAKYLTYLLNKLLRLVSTYDLTVLLTAHLKQNIVMPMQSTHGTLVDSGYRIPGGAALQYLTSQLLSLRKKQVKSIGGFDIKYVEVKILKSRLAPSDKTVTLIYSDHHGFFDLLTNIVFLLENNVITQSAGRYTLPFLDKKITLKEIIQEYKNNTEFKEKFDALVEKYIYEIITKPLLGKDENVNAEEAIIENIPDDDFEL